MAEAQVALLMTFGAALGWSLFDACRKVLAPRIAPIPLTTLLAWAQAPVFVGWTLWASSWEIGPGYIWPALGVLVFNLTASLLFFAALRRSPLSVTVPILSLVPVFAAVAGWLVLGEALSPKQWGGVGLVGFGALFLNARGAELGSVFKLLAAMRREPGSLIMVGVALGWAATSVFDKMAMEFASAEVHAGVQLLMMGILLNGWLIIKGRTAELRAIRPHLPVFFGGVALSIIALSLQLYAVQVMYVGLVEAIKRACGIIFAVVLGRALFQEELTSGKIIAGVFMVTGVYLLG